MTRIGVTNSTTVLVLIAITVAVMVLTLSAVAQTPARPGGATPKPDLSGIWDGGGPFSGSCHICGRAQRCQGRCSCCRFYERGTFNAALGSAEISGAPGGE